MEKKFKSYKMLVYALGALTLLGVIVFTAFERSYYDASLTLWKTGAPVALLYVMFGMALAAALCGALIVSSRSFPLKYRGRNPISVVFSSMLCALSLICVPLILFIRRGDLSDHLVSLWNTGNENVATASLLLKISTVLALGGAVYFILVFFIEKAKAGFAIVSGVWMVSVLLRCYYDMTAIVQDPLRKLTTLAFSAALLFLLAEMFYSTGRPFARPFVAFGALAAFICAAAGAPVVILTVFGFYKLDSSIGYSLFEVGFAIYAYGRLLGFTERDAFFEELKRRERKPRFTIIRKIAHLGRTGDSGEVEPLPGDQLSEPAGSEVDAVSPDPDQAADVGSADDAGDVGAGGGESFSADSGESFGADSGAGEGEGGDE